MNPRLDLRSTWSIFGLIGIITLVGILYRYERSVQEPINPKAPLIINSSNTMKLTSSIFTNGSKIPANYTCAGEDISPPLQWSDIPDNTQSFVLVVRDPDAPAKEWIHWIVINIPKEMREIAEDSVPLGSDQVITDSGEAKWTGPCPPAGSHRYYFDLYALDVPSISAGTFDEVKQAMNGHVLAIGELMGTYQRNK